ncbi:hypothetical protein J6590_067915 [Homalodisca vitripennis]|nr:hypothetical protein J6590_067915 [Homalodisca vitripennis]
MESADPEMIGLVRSRVTTPGPVTDTTPSRASALPLFLSPTMTLHYHTDRQTDGQRDAHNMPDAYRHFRPSRRGVLSEKVGSRTRVDCEPTMSSVYVF